MTEEELKKVLEDMEKEMGPLPNPEHEPIRFAYLVKLYQYFSRRQ